MAAVDLFKFVIDQNLRMKKKSEKEMLPGYNRFFCANMSIVISKANKSLKS